jgi:tRNA A37 threonylcarbamoyladenosine dehydratase
MSSTSWQTRTELLIGKEKLSALRNKHVLVAGLGGVGAVVAEQLCRAGIGKLTIVDGDTVHPSNRNRQLPALTSTTGIAKTEVMRQRLLDINPDLELITICEYIKDERMIEILERGYDYVVDAIDTLSPKVYFLFHAHRLKLPIISSMGAGGKFDPGQVQVADLDDSYNCKLAYYMRKRLHKLGIWKGIKVVFSPEIVSRDAVRLSEGELNKKSTVGTISYMPAVFGCFCASAVIRDLLELDSEENTNS